MNFILKIFNLSDLATQAALGAISKILINLFFLTFLNAFQKFKMQKYSSKPPLQNDTKLAYTGFQNIRQVAMWNRSNRRYT